MFFVIISLFNLCIACYLGGSLIRTTRLKRIVKVFLFALLVLLSQKTWLVLLGDDINNQTVSSFAFYFDGFVQIALFICFCVAVIVDVATGILRIFSLRLPYRVPIILMVSSVITFYGFYEAVKVPAVSYVTISSDMLPADWEEVKIAVLSDLHISSTTDQEKKWLQAVVDKTNSLNADMILITGDIIDDSVLNLSKQMQPLFDLKALDGVYIVFGNHETYHGAQQWENFFKNNGMMVLNDKIISVQLGKNKIALAGIYQNVSLLEKKQVVVPILLMAHYPSVAKKISDNKVFLQLSGHTHGGQFPLLSALVKRANNGFVQGLYMQDHSQIYVHSGTGLWRGFPFRFMIPSEITLITINRK